jgi:hypothetical protein
MQPKIHGFPEEQWWKLSDDHRQSYIAYGDRIVALWVTTSTLAIWATPILLALILWRVW